VPPPDDPSERAAEMFRESEAAFATLTEQLVRREAFGEVLAWTTENLMALTRIVFDVGDTIVRSLRLAGRADINRLARQLARTEDKLEVLLQEVEALRAENRAARQPGEPHATEP
jgi:outer membrane murein-binding lipoprotein Lpp